MPRPSRILIVEDERAIRTGLADVFVYHGYAVEAVDDGERGLALALTGGFDLVLLDVMLPGRNGFEVCEAIRAHDREQPIILLTARAADDDAIRGLTLGADDYVTKPFSVAQLVLRVEAVLRRSGALARRHEYIRLAGGAVVDTRNLCLDAGDVRFTRREVDVLQYLAVHDERPVSREELLRRVWGYARDSGIETRTVDIHIARLRRKLEADPKQPQRLVTVRGGGYRLMTEPS